MNSNELKSFLMVYEYRSFSIAAKRLYVTQSAISKRINNLEHEFKVKLFEMRGGVIIPTLEGQLLIPYARLLLHTFYNAADNLSNPEMVEIPVFLGTSTFPSLQFLPQFMEYLLEHNINSPNFHIRQMAKQDLIPGLQNGMIDLALTTEDLVIDNDILSNQLDEEDVYIVVSHKHELANENKMDFNKLAQYPCILTERGFSIRDNLERIFLKYELPLIVNHELFSLDAIKKLVKTGLGWSALPKQYCNEELVQLKIEGYSEKIKLCWYCHKNRADSKIIKYIAQLLKESLSSVRS
ncbi:LysR family transcriptional regulator [Fluoribacter dumoffii]|uniref:HTH-type transcriptional regulator gltC n=1 Tax=Fluoribacter dumoffii TaxID=463 RepID=A0A377G6N9_9GAMM|nr:LysR family transcriptional regulator [Fluoribacter dumoffii]KTC89325.1 LysR family transcriptional regulator [Fluoribacter dumoffii NY 23]MCW8386916.1 LysR family transcriptional regulator [Fluoribacter dumoffii]MCW8497118.1 LysR family transcriptional regulator [Fluoribacter dumoffii]STO20434.1 HTH-type transcriptional regulator gltC [Fluoribacter dumoffii]